MVTKLILADKHTIFRKPMGSILASHGFDIIADTATAEEAVHLCQDLRPDVLVLELNLKGGSGIEVIREVSTSSKVKCLVVTAHRGRPYVIEALRAGAAGYLLKTCLPQDVVDGIRAVMCGASCLSPDVRCHAFEAALAAKKNDRSAWDDLTERESAMVGLGASGRTTAQIAAELGISRRTAETHRASAMRKLALSNQTDLVRFAVRHGLMAA